MTYRVGLFFRIRIFRIGAMLGHRWGCCHLSPLPLWIADQVRNDGVGLSCLAVTLTFDSSPINGEGDSVGVVLFHPRHPPPL